MTSPNLPGQLGRRPTDPARYAATIRLPLTGAVPAHPLVADHLSAVPRWMLGGNNLHGTCGPTMVANLCVLTWKYLLGLDITVTDEDVYDLYRRSGNPNFDPITGADDNGVDMTVMLSALVQGGITITGPDGGRQLVKPLCFAAHPTAIDVVRAVTSIFGASALAVDLDVAQQTQTDQGLWDYAPNSPAWGGHAIPGGAYTSAPTGADETVITWQAKVSTTDRFISRQLAEAYAVVFEPLWDHPGFQAGVDRAALAAAYTTATGKPFPIPVPPPPPPPSPVPDVHVDVADQQLAAAIPHGWAASHHTGPTAQVAHALTAWERAKNLQGTGTGR